jgi:hypothetical protein
MTSNPRWQVAASLSASALVATVAVAIGWGQLHQAPVYVVPIEGVVSPLYTPFTHAPTGRPARPPHPLPIYTPPAVAPPGR